MTTTTNGEAHSDEEVRPLEVLVVGAGIGGLTAAIALRRDGHKVVILEQAAEFGEVSSPHNLSDICLELRIPRLARA